MSIAFPIARDPPHIELAQSKGEKEGYSKGRRLDRPATNTNTSRPALTPHLQSLIARGLAILEEPRKRSIPIQLASDYEPLNPKSLSYLSVMAFLITNRTYVTWP